MYWKLKAHNFFVTTLDAWINDTDITGTITITDKTVNWITLEDGNYMFWLLVWINNPGDIEIFRITSVATNTLTYDRRISPNGLNTHLEWDMVQINDMWEFANLLADNAPLFWYCETIPGPGNELNVKVYWWRVIDIIWTDIDVSDETLDLTNDSTNYIYLDDVNNEFKVTTTEPKAYYTCATIVAASWVITSLTDVRISYSGRLWLPVSLTDTERSALTWVRQWTIIFNLTSWLPEYFAGWTRHAFSTGTTVPRLSETVEGIARRSTDTEYDNWDDTWTDSEPLVPKVSQTRDYIDWEISDVNGYINWEIWRLEGEIANYTLQEDFDWLLNYFWDGRDWDVVISTNTTLNANKFYNNLTIDSGVTLTTWWYRIYVKWELINNWTISNKWGNATWATWGTNWTWWSVWWNGWGTKSGSGWWAWNNWVAWTNIANAVIISRWWNGGRWWNVTTNNHQWWTWGTWGTQSSTTTMKFVWSDSYNATVTTWISDSKLIYKIINVLRSDDNATLWAWCWGWGAWWWACAFNDASWGFWWGGGWGGGYVCIFANIITKLWVIDVTWWNGWNWANGTWGEWAWGGWGWGGWGWLVVYVYSTLTTDWTLQLTWWTWGIAWTSTAPQYSGMTDWLVWDNWNYVKILIDKINK